MADELRCKLVASRNSLLTRVLNWTLLGSFAGVLIGVVLTFNSDVQNAFTGSMVVLFIGTGLFRVLRAMVVSNNQIIGEVVFTDTAVDVYAFEEISSYPIAELEHLNVIFNGHDLEKNPIVEIGAGLRKMKHDSMEVNWLLLKVNGNVFCRESYLVTSFNIF